MHGISTPPAGVFFIFDGVFGVFNTWSPIGLIFSSSSSPSANFGGFENFKFRARQKWALKKYTVLDQKYRVRGHRVRKIHWTCTFWRYKTVYFWEKNSDIKIWNFPRGFRSFHQDFLDIEQLFFDSISKIAKVHPLLRQNSMHRRPKIHFSLFLDKDTRYGPKWRWLSTTFTVFILNFGTWNY